MNSKIYDIVIFHYPCQDGLASAWITKYYHYQHCKDIEIYPIQHGHTIDLERLINKKVIFCDYSPSLEILNEIEKVTSKITILDHHISAQKALENKPYAIFDMKKSGAGLTWDYFMFGPAPKFIQMIEDRDLWKWKIINSREFTAGFSTVCSTVGLHDFYELFRLFDELYNNNSKLDFYLELGNIINKSNLLKSENIVAKHVNKINNYNGYNVCIVNCHSELASDVGNMLVTKYNVDFAVLWTYFHPKEEYYISLRANNKVDVSEIAKRFGGGGHANASGFSSKLNPINIFK